MKNENQNVNENENQNENENVNENENENQNVLKYMTGMAESTIDPLDVMARLKTMLDNGCGSEGLSFDDIDRLRVSTVTAAIAKKLQDAYKAGAKEEYIRTYGNITGDQLHHNGRVRLYETSTYTWENVHIDDEELKSRNELFREIGEAEDALKVKKAKLKGYDEALAVRFPNSGAIHKKTIISIL